MSQRNNKNTMIVSPRVKKELYQAVSDEGSASSGRTGGMGARKRSSQSGVRRTGKNKKRSTSSTRKLEVKASTSIARGGVACPFPWRMHEMLDYVENHKKEYGRIVSWDKDGESFTVFDSAAFVRDIMPRFFSQTKYTSFQRQLNLYGFSRKRKKSGFSSYFHQLFRRGEKEEVRDMVRCKIKGTGPPRSPHREQEKKQLKNKMQSGTDASMDGTEEDRKVYFSLTDSPSQIDDDDDLLSIGFEGGERQIEDGDLAFFEGSPFHFLDSEATAVVLPLHAAPSQLCMPALTDTKPKPLTRRLTRPFESRPLSAPAPLSSYFDQVENIASV